LFDRATDVSKQNNPNVREFPACFRDFLADTRFWCVDSAQASFAPLGFYRVPLTCNTLLLLRLANVWRAVELGRSIARQYIVSRPDNVEWGTAADGDNIVWGMSEKGIC
jgi:hypothetical protein